MTLTIGSAFAGIGGLELGLELALGARTVWQVEQDPYARSVLARHWPDAGRSVTDIREAGSATLPRVDIICGGFPCQDISPANVRSAKGLDGKASGLWRELLRVITELMPAAVLIENNGQRWSRWVPIVRRDLWALGYASLPLRVSAADCGLPHVRDRAFVVAHPHLQGQPHGTLNAEVARIRATTGRSPEAYPRALGMDDGPPHRMDRLRRLGNAAALPVAVAVAGVLRGLV